MSLVGDEVRPFALTFAALSLDRSPSSLGLVLSAGTLPQLLMLVLGGWWGDRRQALRTIVAADALRAFVLFGAAAALVQGSASIPLLTAAQAMCGVATAFFEPAAGRLALGLSPSDKLIRTNALIGVAGYTGEVVGPGLAAALLTFGGPAAAVSFDAATFVVSALLLGGVAVPAPVAQRKRPMRPFADVRYALAPPAARAVIAPSAVPGRCSALRRYSCWAPSSAAIISTARQAGRPWSQLTDWAGLSAAFSSVARPEFVASPYSRSPSKRRRRSCLR